jgi:hypothetical protein
LNALAYTDTYLSGSLSFSRWQSYVGRAWTHQLGNCTRANNRSFSAWPQSYLVSLLHHLHFRVCSSFGFLQLLSVCKIVLKIHRYGLALTRYMASINWVWKQVNDLWSSTRTLLARYRAFVSSYMHNLFGLVCIDVCFANLLKVKLHYKS